MHFVYKTDNLFQSIKISYGNSSVTKGFHFLKLIWTPDFLCSKCTIQSHVSNFPPFLTSFVLFQAFTHIFELNDHEIEMHYKWSLQRLKVGMVSSFHPHSMCEKVERVMAKTGCTSCIKRVISFEVSGFHTETHLLDRQFKILITYYNSRRFLHKACTIQSHVINFQPFVT